LTFEIYLVLNFEFWSFEFVCDLEFGIWDFKMIINGKELSQYIIRRLRKEFSNFREVNLAIIAVGNNPSVFSFIKQKKRTADNLGVNLKVYRFQKSVSTRRLIQKIVELGKDKKIQGIILQLPLPENINPDDVISFIPPEKDVDGFVEKSVNLPPSVEVVKFLMRRHNINYRGKKVVIVGYGRLVGKPIYNWLKKKNVKIFVIEKQTLLKERRKIIESADILISGVGKANLIPATWIKRNSIIIDFGYDFKNGKIYGDVSKNASKNALLFTPTPNGTGPILVAMIFRNLLKCCKKQRFNIE